jgi:hypothetical protein
VARGHGVKTRVPRRRRYAFFNASTRKRASKPGTGLTRETWPDLSRATREVGPTLGRVLGADRARWLFWARNRPNSRLRLGAGAAETRPPTLRTCKEAGAHRISRGPTLGGGGNSVTTAGPRPAPQSTPPSLRLGAGRFTNLLSQTEQRGAPIVGTTVSKRASLRGD